MSQPISTVKIGGDDRPVHFGHWALKTICEILRIEYAELLAGTWLANPERQFTVALVGLQEGARLAVRSNGATFKNFKQPVDEMTIADWCDEDPDALDDILKVYFESVYGRAIRNLEKAGQTEAADTLKNALAKVLNPSLSSISNESGSDGSDLLEWSSGNAPQPNSTSG